jgi:hypothetical protein
MEKFRVIIEIITFMTVIIGVIIGVLRLHLINKQIKKTYEWNIREMSLKYSGLYHPQIKESKEILHKEFNLYGRKDSIPLDDIKVRIQNNKEIQIHLNNILTYYENISLACLKKVADDEIIFDMCGKTMVSIRHKLINYINYHRELTGNERLWKEFESYSRKFENKLSQLPANELKKPI